MPVKTDALAASIAGEDEKPQAPAAERPTEEAYKQLRAELETMRKRLLAMRGDLAAAIFPTDGPNRDGQRKDMKDWVTWIANEQIGGVHDWVAAAEVTPEGDNPLAAALDEAERRAEEAEAALNALSAQGSQSKVSKSSGAQTDGKGTGGKVKVEASDAVDYDALDAEATDEDPPKAEPTPKPKAKAKPKKAAAKPKK